MFSIRVVNYLGDYDDLGDLLLIGPYDTQRERDADLRRLAGLPEVYGNVELEPSTVDPAATRLRATPAEVADVADVYDLVHTLYRLG